MKIRNLILAGFAICAMFSCSKDEAVDIYANGPVDASLSFNAITAIEMKSAGYGDDDTGMGNEAKVQTLDVYIFKEGALHVYKRYATDNDDLLTKDFVISHLTIKKSKENENFVMYLVANCDQVSSTSLADFQKASIAKDITTYCLGDYMPMVGKVEFSSGDIRPLVDEQGKYWENWVLQDGAIKQQEFGNDADHKAGGAPAQYTPISLIRMISRVQVEKIEVALVDNEDGNASITLKRLSLVNVSTKVNVSGSGMLPWIKTYQSDDFLVKDEEILSDVDKMNGQFFTPVETTLNPLTKVYENQASGTVDFNTDANKANKFYAYACPNNGDLKATAVENLTKEKNYKTILLITGLYKATKNDPGTLKQFRIPIETPNNKGNIVEPNHIYQVTVKITGQGSSNEDGYEANAHVSAKITVAPWKVVIQNEGDAN